MVVEFIVRYQSFIREIINGALMISCAWCSAICALYVYQSWIDSNGNGTWRHELGTRVACALAWVFGFESYRTGSIWSVYFTTGVAAPATGSFVQTFGFIIGGFGLIVAILWCTHLFSPPRLADRLWKLSLLSITVFLVAVNLGKATLGEFDGF